MQPFEVRIDEAVLRDLRQRLAHSRWPQAVEGAGDAYGFDTAYLQEICARWAAMDWGAQQARLNAVPHYRTKVQGQELHVIWRRASVAGATPLVLLHGWPSSFVQMLPLIEPLADPAAHGAAGAPAFDVVVVSLPGYGFSPGATAPGMSVSRIADLVAALMSELGYDRFLGRGSDLGAGVLTQLALKAPERLLGLHLSGTNPYLGQIPDDLTPEEQTFVARAQAWSQAEMAYAQLHSTKPQTLAAALNDSPAGLAAWILEKFQRWSDLADGRLESRYSLDDLLANLTLYWATGSIGASMRLYYESARDWGAQGRIEVPCAYLMAPKDMFPTPRAWVARASRIDRWTETNVGGHFLEWEAPDVALNDLRCFAAEQAL